MAFDIFEYGKKIEDTINSMSFRPKSAAYYMAYKCHRTLQQSFFNLALGFIQICAENYSKGIYDGRNEYACQWSAKIIAALKKDKDFYPIDFSDVEKHY